MVAFGAFLRVPQKTLGNSKVFGQFTGLGNNPQIKSPNKRNKNRCLRHGQKKNDVLDLDDVKCKFFQRIKRSLEF